MDGVAHCASFLGLVFALAPTALAQELEGEPPPVPETPMKPLPISFGGYAEAIFHWNFEEPSNGITNYRAFDNRHNSFTLSNVVAHLKWDVENIIGQLSLQLGHTPTTYSLGEPGLDRAGDGDGSDADPWSYLQEAFVGYRFGRIEVTAGLFLSQVGPEEIAVHLNYNWSGSNLFFALPYFHTGVLARLLLSEGWALTLAGYNGYNSFVDNNDEKTVSVGVVYEGPGVNLSVVYLGGVERERDAPEGRAWRHLFDAYASWEISPDFSVLAHVDAGFEPNRFGVSHWAAGALYARWRALPFLFFAVRGDVFVERAARRGGDRAAPIFFDAPYVGSATATADYRPHEQVSFRFEVRHDRAGTDLFFGGRIEPEDTTPNRATQTTATLGATTWF